MRGKPYVISVDDNMYFFNEEIYGPNPYNGGGLYFAFLSKDKKTIWGPVLEKAYAKLIGNYNRLAGGFLENGIRSLTGAPILSYATADFKQNAFSLLKAADAANYIITANSFLY